MRFRKRSMTVDAIRWDGTDFDQVTTWAEELSPEGAPFFGVGNDLLIPTMGGELTARPGDWIVCGVAGDFYPIADAAFRQSYVRAP